MAEDALFRQKEIRGSVRSRSRKEQHYFNGAGKAGEVTRCTSAEF
jgi:hypothetical protein